MFGSVFKSLAQAENLSSLGAKAPSPSAPFRHLFAPLEALPALEASYRISYAQLNRKIRKIVKNKYRYQKRYE